MLLVQKFNSLDEIDSEFKDSLETLVANELPKLSLLHDFEKKSPQDLVFYYYLFFGHQHNRPVGFFFAQLIPLPETDFLSFKDRMIQKIKKTLSPKMLRLMGPGCTGTYWFFENKYKSHASKEIGKVIKELNTPELFLSEENSLSNQSPYFGDKTYRHKSKLIITPVTLKNNSYENYFNSLVPEYQNQLKLLWKNQTHNKQLEIAEITESFKLPRAAGISEHLKNDSLFFALKDGDKICGLIIFTKGYARHLFLDFIVITPSESFSPMNYLQNALVKAFDFTDHDQLVFSNHQSQGDTFLGISREVLENFKFPVTDQKYSLNIHSPTILENIQKYDLSKYSSNN